MSLKFCLPVFVGLSERLGTFMSDTCIDVNVVFTGALWQTSCNKQLNALIVSTRMEGEREGWSVPRYTLYDGIHRGCKYQNVPSESTSALIFHIYPMKASKCFDFWHENYIWKDEKPHKILLSRLMI